MNESQVFASAVKFVAPGDRTAYLDRACDGDTRLRAAVEALIRAHTDDPDFLEQPIGSLGEPVDPSTENGAMPGPETAGLLVDGRFKLLEQIGEGGMGTVWMAEQTRPVQRLVAVKLVRAGMDSRHVVARFGAERQALALMDHPNIARVLDAGAAEDGRPFFVMELVKGVPITQYCDDHRLTPRQRLELFVPVCHAVQHAHQKGVIHRDLKPSNVLVARYDDRPVPKVIDFGVAKAVGQPLTDQTVHTGFGAVVGTVEYMSPEQATFNQLDIDTRSDIYSLGVLLYELLAGSPPFSKGEWGEGGVLEMLCAIREREPTRPSAKLSTAVGLPTLAANRGTDAGKLARLVRGELDWIVMKALEKDRNRRYETASRLGGGSDAIPGGRTRAGMQAVGRISPAEVRAAESVRPGRGGARLVLPGAAGQHGRLGMARSGGAGRRAGEPPRSGHRARGVTPSGRQARRSVGGTGANAVTGPRSRTRVCRGPAHRLVTATARCRRTGRGLCRSVRGDPAGSANRSGCREERV